jgi:hypothetical protein
MTDEVVRMEVDYGVKCVARLTRRFVREEREADE